MRLRRPFTVPPFRDRHHAGHLLGDALVHLRPEHPLVVGLPRGGVVVAYEVAEAFSAPLDVVVVRKLGAPFQPQFAIGAIGEDGVVLVDRDLAELCGLDGAGLDAFVAREHAELVRRSRLFRGVAAPLPVVGRTVVLVDDGIATGSTAHAAARILRNRGAARIVLAVPVGPPDVRDRFAGVVDEVVCRESPSDFSAVGQAYGDFEQTSDEEVVELLHRTGRPETGDDREVSISEGTVRLAGVLGIPPSPRALVVFAHGSGSSRLSPRNLQVARALQRAGLATLLFDLLTEQEARDRANVFDIPLLGRRLVAATRFVAEHERTAGLGLGYFGASTGAAAALWAAAEAGCDVRAVVSRGGRPDLAAERLPQVTAPTLLIVGGLDRTVVALNEQAAARLQCRHEIAVVAGATHLFEEAGAIEKVGQLAVDWFGAYLQPGT
ncbi:MAG: dienelactone hydrolase family protein [Actinomycetota bacterium]|nr:dienelactone hydrolase family protein [Actinomycetota bacterium]